MKKILVVSLLIALSACANTGADFLEEANRACDAGNLQSTTFREKGVSFSVECYDEG